MSVRQWIHATGSSAAYEGHSDAELQARVDASLFGFTLVIANKDLAMLKELWGVHYIAWDEAQAQRLF